jgi:NADP-dependent 3-hydroxy acid dehydrogenase YdfG
LGNKADDTTLGNKTVLITGASAGIGAATARAFAGAGARLILLARRRDRLEALAEELKRENQTDTHLLELDIREHETVRNQIAALPEEWCAIDVLVNNAGLARGVGKIYEMTPEEWKNVYEVNVEGLLAVTSAVVPGMVQRNSGHVINLGSIAGHETYPGGAVYCSSKYAVRALSRGLKMDLQGTAVRVTSIDPGLVETEFSVVRFSGDSEKAKVPYQGITPLYGEDIADAILWSATRPAHVNIQEMIVFPTAQAASTQVYREE